MILELKFLSSNSNGHDLLKKLQLTHFPSLRSRELHVGGGVLSINELIIFPYQLKLLCELIGAY
jgi:hypothetical protein